MREPAEVAILCDLREEEWPSMDLVAEMLLDGLRRTGRGSVKATMVQPTMRRRFSVAGHHRPGTGSDPNRRWRINADRLLNRFWDYPRSLRKSRGDFSVFHVVDHAYAQLVHALPAERTVVTCHDLHTFQCLLQGGGPPRSRAFRWMTQRTLTGLQQAAIVAVDTAAVGQALVEMGVVPADRVRVAHLGVHPAFDGIERPIADPVVRELLGDYGQVDLLHVGGTFARKRLDLVLRIFAAVQAVRKDVRLIRVGGPLTEEQAMLAENLGIAERVVSLPFVDRVTLAEVYRRSALVVLPSEEEGFGFPVLEGLASGTPVVCSDLPVLREVGGEAAMYQDVEDVAAWAESVLRLLRERERDADAWNARCRAGRSHAARFTWDEYAKKMTNVYRELLPK